MIYKPEESELEPQKATLGVKFSRDTFLSKLWLDDHNIIYTDDELEMTPYGLCARIKKNEDI